MSLVLVVRNQDIVDDSEVKRIVKELPQIVAEALDTPEEIDGRLTKNDIEVLVRNRHYMDVNDVPLFIIIWANDYPTRRANLDDRRVAIVNGVKNCKSPEIRGFVWVMLQPASFGAF